MKFFRIILFPLAIIYGLITAIRNYLFDCGILKSYEFDIPIICVGNLSVGGTGKSPQIEYLIRLLSNKYKVATLSRGYKRSSKGFVLANNLSDVKNLGDEPFQFFSKFKNILVAVDADRKNGIEQLLKLNNQPEIILLDDAFQHRKVKAGFYIMLSTFDDLFIDDFILPTGNLRESRKGANRADVIIITKCPEDMSEQKMDEIFSKFNKVVNNFAPVFFSKISYDDCVINENETLKIQEFADLQKLIVAGIANPKPFFNYLKQENDETITFPDHHNFSEKDVENIKLKALNNLIITTEKDYARLKNYNINNLYYLPIKTEFLEKNDSFDTIILNFASNFSK